MGYRIRAYQRSSDEAARAAGLEPVEHQLLLGVKHCIEREAGGIRDLRQHLGLNQKRTLDLVNRLVQKRLLERRKTMHQNGPTFLQLTGLGEALLKKISARERQHLQSQAPDLIRILHALADGNWVLGAGAD